VFVVFGSSSHPAYAVYRKRLESFPDPFNHVHTTGDLADAGFFYAGYGDCVRCFHCGLGLRSWLPGDGIFEEHYRNRPDCQFLQMKLKASGINPVSLQSPDDLRDLTPGKMFSFLWQF
jgi:baculoviral IAP repeat-containing protein 7/8